eukprot:420527_1
MNDEHVSIDEHVSVDELDHYLPPFIVKELTDLFEQEFSNNYNDIIDDLNNDNQSSEIQLKLYNVYSSADDNNEISEYKTFEEFLNISCVAIYATHSAHIIPKHWKHIYKNMAMRTKEKKLIPPSIIHTFFQYMKKYKPENIIKTDSILYFKPPSRAERNNINKTIPIKLILYNEINDNTESKTNDETDEKLYDPMYELFESTFCHALCYNKLCLNALNAPKFTYKQVNNELIHYILSANPLYQPGSDNQKNDKHIKILLTILGDRLEIFAAVIARKRLFYYIYRDIKDSNIVTNKYYNRMTKMLKNIYCNNINTFLNEHKEDIDKKELLNIKY